MSEQDSFKDPPADEAREASLVVQNAAESTEKGDSKTAQGSVNISADFSVLAPFFRNTLTKIREQSTGSASGSDTNVVAIANVQRAPIIDALGAYSNIEFEVLDFLSKIDSAENLRANFESLATDRRLFFANRLFHRLAARSKDTQIIFDALSEEDRGKLKTALGLPL